MENSMQQLQEGFDQIGIPFTDRLSEQFQTYYEFLIERNQQINLTAITEWPDVVGKHFLDSLSLLMFIPVEKMSEKKVLDLGTGAGFPGVPLAMVLPDTQFVLTDSLQKRTIFLEELCQKLDLSNVSIVHARAEDLGKEEAYREQFDVVVSRAVANLSVLSEYCLPFVKIGGWFTPFKTEDIDAEADEASFAIETLGGVLSSIERFVVPTTDLHRSIVKIQKKKHSPHRYPRKAGTPARSPLKKGAD